ncbi:MAG: hypothetical protein U1E76_23875 [Planctomycetota bacterium]
MTDRHRWQPWLLALCVAAASALAYANAGEGEFLYDDLPYIRNNPVVVAGNVSLAFTQPLPPDQPQLALFRPLTVASWALQARWCGFDARWFHAVNVLLHAMVAALVVGLGLALGLAPGGVLVAGLLFAVHPAHVESVAWITGRSELLATLFLLCALLAWLRGRSPRARLGAMLACLAAALLSKETAFTFPLLLLIVAGAAAQRGLRPTVALLGSLGLIGLVALWRIAVLGRFSPDAHLAPFVNAPILERTLIPLDLLARYVALMAWPAGLRVFYHRTEFGVPGVGHLLLLALLAATIVIALRRDRRLALLLLWFVAALLPVLNIVPIQETFAERFTYLPSIGWCLFLGQAIAHLGRLERARLGSLASAVLIPAAAVLLLLTLTIQRNRDWRTSLTLWEAQARAAPQFAYSHYQLGYYYRDRNIIEPTSAAQRGAIAEFLESLRLDPNHRYAEEAHRELGKLLMQKQQWQNAAYHFQEALRFDADDFTALINLIYCDDYLHRLTVEQRRELLEHAHRVAPDDDARRRVEEQQSRPSPPGK